MGVIGVDLSAAVRTGVLEELQMIPVRRPLFRKLREAVRLRVILDLDACGFLITASYHHQAIRGHWMEAVLEPISESLADPNCFRKAACSLASNVDRHTARLLPIDQEVDLVDRGDQQRLLALKAFWLARQADVSNHGQTEATFAADVLELLELEDGNNPVTIRRQMFYLLIRATSQPADKELVQQASQLGRRFREFGGSTPLAPWERLVEAFRRPRANGRRPDPPAEDDWSQALAASRLPVDSAQKFDWFLRKATLQDIAFLQGIL
jgi:hypothetical protein